MLDKIIVLISICLMIAFWSIVMFYVREPDLLIIMTIGLGIMVYDFWVSVLRKKADDAEHR